MTSPALEAAAASTRTESELRALLRAKLESDDAYQAHCRAFGTRNADSVTMDERIDFEVESNRLWNIHYAACLAVAAYNFKQREAA